MQNPSPSPVRRFRVGARCALPLLFGLSLAVCLVWLMGFFGKTAEATPVAAVRSAPQAATIQATLFVSSTGTDAGNCQSQINACRTLQYAVNQAQLLTNKEGIEIRVAEHTYSAQAISIDLAAFDTELTELLIRGGYSEGFRFGPDPSYAATLDGSSAGTVFSITGPTDRDVTVVIRGLTVRGGKGTNGGGVYVKNAAVDLQDVDVTNNSATNGGGVYVDAGATLTADDDTAFENNSATEHGGAIHVAGGTAHFNGASFTANAASGEGGVAYVSDADGSVHFRSGVGFVGNSAAGNGALLSVVDGSAFFTDTAVSTHVASAHGVIAVQGGRLQAKNSSFTGNVGTSGDGVIHATGSTVTLDGVTATGNQARNGGLLYAADSQIDVRNSTLTQNSATAGRGGAFHVLAGTVTITSSTWISNAATSDGGALYGSGSTLTISGGSFTGNYTSDDGSGGAIFWEEEAITVSGGTVFERNGAAVDASELTASARVKGLTSDPLPAEIAEAFRPRWRSVEEIAEIYAVDELGNVGVAVPTDTQDVGSVYAHVLGSLMEPIPDDVGHLVRSAEQSPIALERSAVMARANVTQTLVITKSGGALYSYNVDVTASGVSFADNQAQIAGGALYMAGGSLTLTGGSATGNQTHTGPGGGFYLDHVDGTVNGTLFRRNEGTNGGGVYSLGGSMTFDAINVITNTAYVDGGGLFLIGGQQTVRESTIEENESDRGGGLYLDGGAIEVTRNLIQNNTASFERMRSREMPLGIGVGLYISGTNPLTFTHNLVSGHQVPYQSYVRTVGFLTQTEIITKPDGTLHIIPAGPVTKTVEYYDSGGGMYLIGGVSGLISHSIFKDNEASFNGGAMVIDGGKDLTLVNNEFVQNSIVYSTAVGSAIYMSGTTASLIHNTIADNVHKALGGYGRNSAIFAVGGQNKLTLYNNIIANHEIGIQADEGSEAIGDGNLWGAHSDRHWSNGLFDSKTIHYFGDPAFVDAAGYDYRIQRSSAAYNIGAAVADAVEGGFAATDLNAQTSPPAAGNQRLGPPDAGAHEFIYERGVLLFGGASSRSLAKDLETTYTFTVINASKNAVPAVTLRLALPPQQQATGISGPGCSQGSLTCNLGGMAVGDVRTVTVDARVTQEGTPGTSVPMNATATVAFAGISADGSDTETAVTTHLYVLGLDAPAAARAGEPVWDQKCRMRVINEDDKREIYLGQSMGGRTLISLNDMLGAVLRVSDELHVSGFCPGPLTVVGNKFKDYSIKIQGGWSSDFSVVDPEKYPTTLETNFGTAISVLNEGVEPTIENFTIQNGQGLLGGGVYVVNASPVFSNVNVSNSSALVGGGVYIDVFSKPKFVNSRIENNSATLSGGGVYALSSGTFENSTIRGNSASNDGGGLYLSGSDLQITGGSIEDNSASNGGGIYMEGSRAQVRDAVIRNNSAEIGGGIYALRSPAIIQSNQILNNSASTGGMSWTPIIFDLGILERGGGGGIYAEQSDVQILNNYMSGNSASGNGGAAIHLWDFNAPQVAGNIIVKNNGKGIYAFQQKSILKIYIPQLGIILQPLLPLPVPELLIPLQDKPEAKFIHNTIADNSGEGIYVFGHTNTSYLNNLMADDVKVETGIVPHFIFIIGPFYIPIVIPFPTFYPPDAHMDTTLWAGGASLTTAGSSAFAETSDANALSIDDPAFQDPATGDYHIKRISEAFNTGEPSGVSQDIDKEQFKQGGYADIGADEYTFRRTRYAVPVGGGAANACTNWRTPCTLQNAIDSAEDGDLIKLAGQRSQAFNGIYTELVDKGVDTPVIAYVNKSVTIQGGYCATSTPISGSADQDPDICDWENPHPDRHPTILDAGNGGRGLYIVGEKEPEIFDVIVRNGSASSGNGLGGGLYVVSATATISNVQITGSTATRGGGAYFVGGASTLHNVLIENNTASEGGGLYLAAESKTTVQQSTITGNSADRGAGIYASESEAKFNNNVVENNTATESGGGVQLINSAVSMELDTVRGNRAPIGGGFHLGPGEPQIISATVSSNVASVDGGGVYIDGSAGTFGGGTVADNTATNGRGGGFYVTRSEANIRDNTVERNQARTGGGMHFFAASDAIVTGNVVRDNSTSGDGGGAYLDASSLMMENNQFVGNAAVNGAGLFLINFSAAQMTGNRVEDNSASGDGGGIFARLSNASLIGTTLRANTAGGVGGGIFAKLSKMVFDKGRVEGNTAGSVAGGVYLDESDTAISASVFYTNTANGGDGGGLYVLRSNGASVRGSDFGGNKALGGGNGGGIYISDSNITLSGRSLTDNEATGRGGGLFADKSDITFNGFLVRGNTAPAGAGALLSNGSDATMNANAFVDNVAAGQGAALLIEGSSPSLRHTTIARNSGEESVYVGVFGPVVSNVSLVNTIVAGQSTGFRIEAQNYVLQRVTLWHEVGTEWTGPTGVYSSTEDLYDDPRFADDGYHIQKTSPAVNAAEKSTIESDIDGDAIPQAGIPDIGADEYPVECLARNETNPQRTYTNVQEAVDDATQPGELIKVAGTCLEAFERNGTVQVVYLDKDVHIRGGYDPENWVTSYPVTQPTTLSPVMGGRVFYIAGDVQPTIESLIVKGGKASGQGGGPDGQDAGGNFYIVDASPTISNTTIQGGEAVYGSAGYLIRSSARFITNTVEQNSNATAGGGFFLQDSDATFEDNVFQQNGSSKDGGAFFLSSSPATIQNNTFTENGAGTAGGAIFLDGSDGAVLRGNTFRKNAAASGNGSAGAIYLDFSDATVVGNLFEENSAASAGAIMVAKSKATIDGNRLFKNSALNGGGIYVEQSEARIVNNVVVSNTITSSGAGIYVLSGAPRLDHNTFVYNSGGDGSVVSVVSVGGVASAVTLRNNIFAHQTLGIFVQENSTVDADGTLWWQVETPAGTAPGTADGFSEGSTRITADPLFVDVEAMDFRLAVGSPAIEAALPSDVRADFEGHPRPTDARSDIGADEYYNPEMTLSSSAEPAPSVAGGETTFVFQVSNVGNVPLTARITGTVPLLQAATTWGASIAPGQTWAQSMTELLSESFTGDLEYVFHVSTQEGPADTFTNTVTVEPPQRDLVASIERRPEQVLIHRPVTYDLMVRNAGNRDLTVTITNTLPTQTEPTGERTWTTTIAAGSTWTEQIEVTPISADDPQMVNKLEATAPAPNGDPIATSATDEATIGVPGADLAVSFEPAPLVLGQPFTVHVLITNTGTVPLQTNLTTTLAPDHLLDAQVTPLAVAAGEASTQSFGVPASSHTGPITGTAALRSQNGLLVSDVATSTITAADLGPDIVATSTGDWTDPDIWVPPRLPTADDVVQVNAGVTVTVEGPIRVESLVNKGCIVGAEGVDVEINASDEIQNKGCIEAADGDDGGEDDGEDGGDVTINAPTVHNEGDVTAGDGGDSEAGNGGDGGDVTVEADVVNNADDATLRAGNGGNSGDGRGGDGGDANVEAESTNNGEDAAIQAGNGGDGRGPSGRGGNGGSAEVTLSDEDGDLTNEGAIAGGDGGDGDAGEGGNGGDAKVTGAGTDGAPTGPPADGGDVRNEGDVTGGDGGDGNEKGGDGGNVRVDAPGADVENEGNLGGGDGGAVTGEGDAGDGGAVQVVAGDVRNDGDLEGGKGGDARGTGPAQAGDGGDVDVVGGQGDKDGDGDDDGGSVQNGGNVNGGDGGATNPDADRAQDGGDGGDVTLMASPDVTLDGGAVTAGDAGDGAAGGDDGNGGDVTVAGGDGSTANDPSVSISGEETKLAGDDITLIGGATLAMDLSNLDENAIQAEGALLVAVGAAGKVDLTGNSGEVLAAQQIEIYAAAIALNDGLTLADLTSVIPTTGGARLVYAVRLLNPLILYVRPGQTVPIPVLVTNISPVGDSYILRRQARSLDGGNDEREGWSIAEMPEVLAVEGSSTYRTFIQARVPTTAAVGSSQLVEFNAVSMVDESARASATTRLIVRGEPFVRPLYLPWVGRVVPGSQQNPLNDRPIYLPWIRDQNATNVRMESVTQPSPPAEQTELIYLPDVGQE